MMEKFQLHRELALFAYLDIVGMHQVKQKKKEKLLNIY